MKRWTALIVLAAALAGCSKASTTGTGQNPWTKPGVLRIAVQAEPKSLDPLLASDTTDNMITRLMFEPLISANAAGDPVPILVKTIPTRRNGGISNDGLTITYHLRKGITWSDGVPLTSADVKFTWQAIMNPNNDVISRHGYGNIASIDTPNPLTVIVHLKKRFSPFVNTFFAESDSPYTIVPKHILDKYPNVNQIPFNNEPVGAGPFRLAEWVKGDHLTLVPNKHFFLGAPKLKRIIIHFIPDENTSLTLLRTHNIDWMFEPSYETYATLKTIPGIVVRHNNINGYEGMQINTAHPPLNNVLVRRALAYGIDKKELLQTLTFGEETMATEDLPNWMWAYNPHVTVYPYDPTKAQALLARAGWLPGPGGIRTKNGKRLSLLLVTNSSNATRYKEAQLIQRMLKHIGIAVQIKLFNTSLLFAPAGMGGILQKGTYDLALDGWFSGIDPDDSSNYECKNIPPGGYNYTRYCSKAMDAAQRDALSHYSRAARKVAYAKVEDLLSRDVPQIFFWWDRQAQAVNPDFKGFHPNPVTESWNAWQWSI
ncbi:MAG: peptide ABC transporter substrate-binding protein [Vulcanimicrobiaceae bacterium]